MWRRLDEARAKNLFLQTIIGKIFGTILRNTVKVNKTWKMWYLISRAFSLPLLTFTIWKEDWALGCVSTNICYFSNISKFPQILSLKSSPNTWGNLCSKFIMWYIKCRFTCSDSDLSEIIKKCQNIITMIVINFFPSVLFQWSFNFLGNVNILGQKCYFLQKTTNRQS